MLSKTNCGGASASSWEPFSLGHTVAARFGTAPALDRCRLQASAEGWSFFLGRGKCAWLPGARLFVPLAPVLTRTQANLQRKL